MPNGLSDLLGDFGLSQNQVLGGEGDYLSELLRGRIEGGLPPELQKLLEVGTQSIGRTGQRSRRSIRENLASSGFRGAGANIFSDVFRNQAESIAGLNANVGQLGLQSKQSDIGNLLGLNQQQIGAGSNIFNQLLGDQQFGRSLAEMMRQFDESNSFGFEDILGALTGGASTALMGFGLSKL